MFDYWQNFRANTWKCCRKPTPTYLRENHWIDVKRDVHRWWFPVLTSQIISAGMKEKSAVSESAQGTFTLNKMWCQKSFMCAKCWDSIFLQGWSGLFSSAVAVCFFVVSDCALTYTNMQRRICQTSKEVRKTHTPIHSAQVEILLYYILIFKIVVCCCVNVQNVRCSCFKDVELLCTKHEMWPCTWRKTAALHSM